ncbi:hydroxymethylglutaryl-CoA synthase [uncultured Limosilactobacillus sp.]|uniref:hydroxymethylglutaryl-CoA synthase n=1 Tax=uncultured Limosilactobacillus sp. TaxID=2837629 RepID=UPI0025F1AC54|nr:hydroxymethylglutaryl-CoA synthase [uncultured Limosilactobacillus sp.]
MQIGIDKLSFATTPFYLDLVELARARDVDPNKYLIGIGQEKQAVVPPTQDAVTLGAAAALKLMTPALKERISTVLVATESGVDNSKATAVYIKRLLGLSRFTRVVELKEACYAATAGVMMAKGLVATDPQSVVLVIGTDIARYGLNTPGEVTQGAGAVAMTITANPRLLSLDQVSVTASDDLMDFWRPLYSEDAMVDGKYSTQVYIDFFLQTFERYQEMTGRQWADFDALLFHLPFTKMGKKALEALLGDHDDPDSQRLRAALTASQQYCRQVGNLYTGSLYLSLLSYLQNGQARPGQRLGLFSYGSGAEGEFYSGVLQPNFENQLNDVAADLATRQQLSVAEYEKSFNGQLGLADTDVSFDTSKDPSPFWLTGQGGHQRQYQVNQ